MNKYGHEGFDQASYEMGIIGCFSEMVAARLKKIAFSTPIPPERLPIVEQAAKELTGGYHIHYYIDNALLKTDMEPDSYVEGKAVLVIYEKQEYLDAYLALKAEQDKRLSNGTYTDEIRHELTMKLCALLGYPEERSQERFGKEGK